MEHLDQSLRSMLMRFFKRNKIAHCEAEDLTQEVFLRIFGRFSSSPIISEKKFSFAVARNILKDYNRYKVINKIAINCAANDSFYSDYLSLCPLQDRIVESRQELDIVLLALDELDERTKDIFLLFKVENMKQSEIAQMVGISVSAVEKHVAKASVHLAVRMGR